MTTYSPVFNSIDTLINQIATSKMRAKNALTGLKRLDYLDGQNDVSDWEAGSFPSGDWWKWDTWGIDFKPIN